MSENPYLEPCADYQEGKPHPPHQMRPAHCKHDKPTWCYGIPEPDSLDAHLRRLRPGQRVMIVWEGVVEDPSTYHPRGDASRLPVVAEAGPNDRLVLRYTGERPWQGDSTPLGVAGRVNAGIVAVKVLPNA